MKKKYALALLLSACTVIAAGCGNKEKETEAPKAVETAAARDTEAAAAETEAAAAVETEAAAAATEAAAVETEAAAVAATVAETEAETTVPEMAAVETEPDAYNYAETESESYDYTETETEYVVVPKPEYNVSDYLKIEDDAYKNLTVQVAPAQKATDEEVNEEINTSITYLEDYDEIVVKKTEGKVKSGDTVNIDYVGTKDGEAFDGGSAQGYDLEIGSGSFIDGFEEGLIGKEIGSEVDLNLTFPEDYGVEDLNGADVVFHVTLNYIAEIPELTDELAKKLSGGEYDNVKDYVESVRSSIQSGYDEDYQTSVFTMIMGKLSELYPVEQYPEANIEYNINDIMDRYIKPYASMYGMSLDDFIASAYNGLTEEEFRETQLAPAAQANLAQEIILTAIAEKEGITMTDQELDKLLASYAEEYGETVEELTAGMDRESIRSSELQQAVMNWLYENVTIEEVEETEPAELSGFETEAETEISAAQTEAETAAMTETE